MELQLLEWPYYTKNNNWEYSKFTKKKRKKEKAKSFFICPFHTRGAMWQKDLVISTIDLICHEIDYALENLELKFSFPLKITTSLMWLNRTPGCLIWFIFPVINLRCVDDPSTNGPRGHHKHTIYIYIYIELGTWSPSHVPACSCPGQDLIISHFLLEKSITLAKKQNSWYRTTMFITGYGTDPIT